jgi:hypothetical protein
MSASVFKFDHTGTGVMAYTATVPVGQHYRLVSVSLHLSSAPTTSENFTITLNSVAGAIYDTLLYSIDLSAAAVTDLVWMPDEEMFLQGGDAIDLAFTNTDARNYGAQITMKAV